MKRSMDMKASLANIAATAVKDGRVSVHWPWRLDGTTADVRAFCRMLDETAKRNGLEVGVALTGQFVLSQPGCAVNLRQRKYSRAACAARQAEKAAGNGGSGPQRPATYRVVCQECTAGYEDMTTSGVPARCAHCGATSILVVPTSTDAGEAEGE